MKRFIVDKCCLDAAHHSHDFIKLNLWLPDKKVFWHEAASNTVQDVIILKYNGGWLQKPEERYWKT